ncbi:MAG: hypothetical protein MZV63_01140 [Marinilabiliales bacterium]|nr:hypothetical protein [Marinilabiliales bacterium]
MVVTSLPEGCRRISWSSPSPVTRYRSTALDAAYIISGDVGYIKLSRFSEQTAIEFEQAVEKLRS